MAINFPNNPAVNDTFTVGGTTFTFTGVKWETSAVVELSSDITPTLGGDLDANAKIIKNVKILDHDYLGASYGSSSAPVTITVTVADVGGNNKLPYVFNFTENTENYLSNSFKSDLISSIKYTDSLSGTGSEVFLIVGNGNNSAIWLWDDLSEGYGISNNELTFVADLPNFNNDNLNESQIVFGSI